jgi:hypothetical protein
VIGLPVPAAPVPVVVPPPTDGFTVPWLDGTVAGVVPCAAVGTPGTDVFKLGSDWLMPPLWTCSDGEVGLPGIVGLVGVPGRVGGLPVVVVGNWPVAAALIPPA